MHLLIVYHNLFQITHKKPHDQHLFICIITGFLRIKFLTITINYNVKRRMICSKSSIMPSISTQDAETS